MYKKTILTFLFILVLALSVSSTPNSQGEVEILDISGSSFVGTIGDDFIGTFNVTNTDPNATLNVNIIHQNFDPSYTITIIPQSLQIPPGGRMPVAFAIDTDDTDTVGVTTGRFRAEHNATNFDFFDVNLNYASQSSKLNIEQVEFEDTRVNEGETYDKVEPGDNFRINVRVKNIFEQRTQDTEIEDIKLELTIRDFLDEGREDLELDITRFRMEAGEIESREFEFEVPFDVDNNKDYNVIITASGRDRTGFTHEDSYRAILEVNKENDDVRFTRLIIDPTTVKCNRDVTVDVEVTNFGSNNQRDAAYSIRNEELGINIREDFELDNNPSSEDYDFNSFSNIRISDDVPAGNYRIIAKTFYDRVDESQVQVIQFTVEECELIEDEEETTPTTPEEDEGEQEEEQQETVDTNQNNNQEEAQDIEEPSPSGEIDSRDLPSKTDNKGFVIAMVLLVIIFAASLIGVAYFVLFMRE